jgi:hypothetical protein
MEHNQTSQSTTIVHQTAYAEHLLFEISDTDIREDALRVLSKVLPIYLLFFCPFLWSFMGFTINQNLKGCEFF